MSYLALAKQTGATTYTNRHFPDRTFTTFSPEQLIDFVRLVKEEEHKYQPVQSPTKDQEQSAFEDWITRVCPSGDAQSVQYQWSTSSDYLELFEPQPVQSPAKKNIYLTPTQEQMIASGEMRDPREKPWYKKPPFKTVQLEGYPKMQDGCCHKTVVTRCKDCSYLKEIVDKK